jgi:hypothetical protein
LATTLIVTSLVLACIAFNKTLIPPPTPVPTDEGTFTITWNISDPTATGIANDTWLYSKTGNVVVIKGSGFLTPLSITVDDSNRFFIGKGLPNKLLPGPTSQVFILVAAQGDDFSVYTGSLNFTNVTTNPNNNGQLTLQKSINFYSDFGFLANTGLPFTATVGVRPYSFSYKIG